MGRIKEVHIGIIEAAEKDGELKWIDGEAPVDYSIFADSLLFNHENKDLILEGSVYFESSVDDGRWFFERKKIDGKYHCLLRQAFASEMPEEFERI